MDCGPASLKCLLEGHGIQVGYDRLREACQTDVDGTSVDTIEESACAMGLAAEQVVVPIDHVLLPEAKTLPALLVVRTARGLAHFLVVWRIVGPWVQVMDPAVGRRWLTRRRLEDEIYRHAQVVPAEAWRDWAGGDEFGDSLMARMTGVDERTRRDLLEKARADPSWRSLAILDGVVRMTDRVAVGAGLANGKPRAELLSQLFEDCRGCSSIEDMPVPATYWSVRPRPDMGGSLNEEGTSNLEFVGAVLIRISGGRGGDTQATPSASLRRALDQPKLRPFPALWKIVRDEYGLGWPLFLALSLGFAAAAMVLEVLFFRGFLDLGARLVLPEQRLTASLALLAFLAFALVLEALNFSGVFRVGRHLELRFRTLIMEQLARMPDAYFRSRLSSDMAERSHNLHSIRELSKLAGSATKSAWQILLTAGAIIWIDRDSAPLVVLASLAAILLPILVQPSLRERDLRTRTHAGALSRFYLDALIGLIPIRSHVAGGALRTEHEGLLAEWVRSAFRRERAKLLVDLIQAGTGYGFAIWLVAHHLAATQGLGELLLLAYWALQLQILGQQLTLVGEQLPKHYSVAVRLLEPLPPPDEWAANYKARTEVVAKPTPAQPGLSGVPTGLELGFEDVQVMVSGHCILKAINLRIPAGQHVAIVGPSGAGKSSLLGCLLGWNEASSGRIVIDGEPLDALRLEQLRSELVWVDPAVQLWNRPLLANLLYGNQAERIHQVGGAIRRIELDELVQQMPFGLQSPLGESGSLVSGGEGQRVRMARSWLRGGVRLALLDEPFRGLDRTQRQRLTAEARLRFSGANVLYVSHDIEQALDFDRVLVIDGGTVVEDGPPDQLLDKSSRFDQLLADWRASQDALVNSSRFRRIFLEAGELSQENLRAS